MRVQISELWYKPPNKQFNAVKVTTSVSILQSGTVLAVSCSVKKRKSPRTVYKRTSILLVLNADGVSIDKKV